MTKCPVCSSRKGKRKCLVTKTIICSVCCGETRKSDTCEGCSHYQASSLKRRYSDVPSYSPKIMDENFHLQDYSNVIESTLCAFDNANDNRVTDEMVIRILELLLDKYHFKDNTVHTDDNLLWQGFQQIVEAITTDLPDIPEETLIKIIAVIYFVAKRRSKGKREYLELISQMVGARVASGIRILPKDSFLGKNLS